MNREQQRIERVLDAVRLTTTKNNNYRTSAITYYEKLLDTERGRKR